MCNYMEAALIHALYMYTVSAAPTWLGKGGTVGYHNIVGNFVAFYFVGYILNHNMRIQLECRYKIYCDQTSIVTRQLLY